MADRCDGFLPDGTDCPQAPVHDRDLRIRPRSRSADCRPLLLHLRLCDDCYAAGGWAHRKPPALEWTDDDDARR